MLAPAGLQAGRGMARGALGGELWANDLDKAPKAGEPRSLASSTGGGP
jgi:hypothetical protein